MSSFRHLARSYAWFAIAGFTVVLAVVVAPVIWQILLFIIGFIFAPVFIIFNVFRGRYLDATLLAVFYAAFLYIVIKNIDKILHAIAWVRVVVGDLFGIAARPSAEHSGEHEMADDNPLEHRRKLPLDRISGNPLDTLAQSIKARFATKTAEEMAKALRAKADLYSADTQVGQAMLTHEDTAVELDPNNVKQRRENKQAELDIKAAERKFALKEAQKKLSEAEITDTQLFERKREIRSIDAKDEAFEEFEFASAKDLEYGRQYVKRRKQIEDDLELTKKVRDDLLNKLDRQYEAWLAGKGTKAQGA